VALVVIREQQPRIPIDAAVDFSEMVAKNALLKWFLL
jgi:hypothetical protein